MENQLSLFGFEEPVNPQPSKKSDKKKEGDAKGKRDIAKDEHEPANQPTDLFGNIIVPASPIEPILNDSTAETAFEEETTKAEDFLEEELNEIVTPNKEALSARELLWLDSLEYPSHEEVAESLDNVNIQEEEGPEEHIAAPVSEESSVQTEIPISELNEVVVPNQEVPTIGNILEEDEAFDDIVEDKDFQTGNDSHDPWDDVEDDPFADPEPSEDYFSQEPLETAHIIVQEQESIDTEESVPSDKFVENTNDTSPSIEEQTIIVEKEQEAIGHTSETINSEVSHTLFTETIENALPITEITNHEDAPEEEQDNTHTIEEIVENVIPEPSEALLAATIEHIFPVTEHSAQPGTTESIEVDATTASEESQDLSEPSIEANELPTVEISEEIWDTTDAAEHVEDNDTALIVPSNGTLFPFESTSTIGKKGRKSFKEIDAEVDLIQVPSDDVLFSKQYYPISQVAKWFRVNNSLLRFWENEFDILKPRKNRKGDRLFRPEDIKNLQIIYYLLRQKKYTIAGARKYIKNNRKTVDANMKIVQTLNEFKRFLLELKVNSER